MALAIGKTYYIKNVRSNKYLNVYGSDTVSNGRNVCLYAKEDCKAQKWVVTLYGNGARVLTTINQAYGLNTYDNDKYNCTMCQVEDNDTDTIVDFITVDASQNKYKIKMISENKYLRAAGTSDLSNVHFSELHNDDFSVWQLEDADALTPTLIPNITHTTAQDVPIEIKDRTFFIKNEETGVFLNVYGNEFVQNTTDVTTYEAEDCLAQRWIAKDTSGGGKLFTALNSAFALNIVGVGESSDCTMYTALGNDTDSALEFIPQGNMVYKIKMHHHNKYLTALTDDRMSNVYFDENDEGYSLWRFMKESEVDFDPSDTIGSVEEADSVLVTKFIPAHTDNYSPSRKTVGGSIEKITIHHMAGNMSIDSLGRLWQTVGRNGSSHYGVNGTLIGQYVKEDAVAWTDGYFGSNKRSVTIETANSTLAPNWEVSDTTLETLIKLVADIARRNKLGALVVGQNLTYHSMYSATACPGPYLLSKMQEIADRANEINDSKAVK